MSSDIKANYDAVLADLIARRDKLNSAIEAIQGTLGIRNGSVSTVSPETPPPAAEIGRHAFFGMSIPDAAKKFLAMSREPKSTNEISIALERGGLTHSAGNFANSVGSILHRLDSANGEIVRVSRGTWGLLEWYPGRRRPKASKTAEDANLDGDSNAHDGKNEPPGQ